MGINRYLTFNITNDNGIDVEVKRDVKDGEYQYWIKQGIGGDIVLLNRDQAEDLVTCLEELLEAK